MNPTTPARELTDWFPADVKPVRVGVYETQSPTFGYDDGWFSHWDGDRWGAAYLLSPVDAEMSQLVVAARQDRPWRGLRSPVETQANPSWIDEVPTC